MADHSLIPIFSPEPKPALLTKCSNHPATTVVNTCDACQRSLCAECLGPSREFNYRVYYYCKDAACQRAYQTQLKPRVRRTLILLWTLGFPALAVVLYPVMALLGKGEESAFVYSLQAIAAAASGTLMIASALQGKEEKE